MSYNKLKQTKRIVLVAAVVMLVAAIALQSCTDDVPQSQGVDIDALVEQGRYLSAKRITETAGSGEGYATSWFAPGTPYRLLAFTKPYDESTAEDDTNSLNYLRFNTVAWEGCTTDSLRYINILSDPDKWFGFSAVDGETGGSDGRVSLDFYGFTYGVAENYKEDYIELHGSDGGAMAAGKSVNPAEVWRFEQVDAGGELLDLLWGKLLNRNVKTVSANVATSRSIVPFRHCFSRLRFIAVQEPDTTDEGIPVDVFTGLKVTNVRLTGTYSQANVRLSDGKVEIPTDLDACDRTLNFNDSFVRDNTVTHKMSEMGQMIVIPSAGEALLNPSLTDGYNVGVEITVQSDSRKDIEQFLINNNDAADRTVIDNGDGTFSCTIKKGKIYDNRADVPTLLKFQQGTAYTLLVSFQREAVRIITVTPQVEEWLPGEGSAEDPWQNQALGEPQMFDNVYWSDRNLGSDHYDPCGATFEKTIGYFYQSGRNIPYYPFDKELYKDGVSHPSWADIDGSVLADARPYYNASHKLYPIVDDAVLRMLHQTDGYNSSKNSDYMWTMSNDSTPQMYIPEAPPTDAYFDFMKGSTWSSGLADTNSDNHWEYGSHRQPVSGGWCLPTAEEFQKVFPSTPFAGNICFRGGGNSSNPMDSWGNTDLNRENDSIVNTLRVTVPYYTPGMAEPTNCTAAYLKAWKTLKDKTDNPDPGTTHIDCYSKEKPNTSRNIGAEPDGDPADGYASIYVLSREEGCVERLSPGFDANNYVVKEWGTIFAIKRAYTSGAYRMRWRVVCTGLFGALNTPALYVEVCRYRCNSNSELTETNYRDYDWEHPAATIYFPICGLGDHDGYYINFGTECQYAVADAANGWLVPGVQIKITGDNTANTFMSVIRKAAFNRSFGKQIRPIMK